jgi:hypothetical protein
VEAYAESASERGSHRRWLGLHRDLYRGKRFYASWRKPLWGRVTSAAFGVLLLIFGVLSLISAK